MSTIEVNWLDVALFVAQGIVIGIFIGLKIAKP